MSPAEESGLRLRRLLAMIPWIADQAGGVTVDELARRFGSDTKRVARDLELLGQVDAAGEFNVSMWAEDERWFVDGYGHLGEPVRLTAPEGFALVTTIEAILAVPGADASGPLASARTKLRTALASSWKPALDLPEPEFLDAVRQAVADHRRLEVQYYTASRDDVTSRRIDPLRCFLAEGDWHVIAHCHLTESDRDFRVDRIRALRDTGESFEPREPTMRTGVAFQPAERTQPVVLDVAPEHWWVAEAYPVRDVTRGTDGRIRLTVDVAGPAWLESLLLRLGANAWVVEPDELRTLGPGAARRLLRLYEG